ncbi:hypothetical protein J3L16_11195 [Alteromonas sp. 5E99-2]|uniref:hypothetical protein n=1 Tax=Alteromonas sp. 5E99-2 TaxID=2817683 RepID=UPI001A992BE5|nr:hypothetical protein [Alteromonas sp. 5E99-2]MBO1256246.1 hypothetical protein [Alteromonas sp. 5E99-2]
MSEQELSNEPENLAQDDWIHRLKKESWEAELLISAIAIFGTFQLFGLIDWATNRFIDYLHPSQYLLGYMIVFLGLLAISILVSMFVIHFALRAYWIGLIGLSSVFPDFSTANSVYSEIYTKRLLLILPKLQKSQQKIDELCSVIFSAAFLLLLVYSISAVIFSAYIFSYNFLIEFLPKWLLLIPVWIFVSIISMHGLFSILGNMSKFNEHEKIQRGLFYTVHVSYILISGPMYKYVLQISTIFSANFKKKKGLVFLLALFVIIGVGVATYKMIHTNIPYLTAKSDFYNDGYEYFDESHIYPDYYQTQNQNRTFLLSPEIDSDVVKGGVIKIFIPIFKHEAGLQKKACGVFEENDEAEGKARARENAFELNCYKQYHQVILSGKSVEASFMQYRHPRTKQDGILGYIDTQALDLGHQSIVVKKIKGNKAVSKWRIPFYFLGQSSKS